MRRSNGGRTGLGKKLKKRTVGYVEGGGCKEY